MQKKTCPNGHVYDQSQYGDICPLCPHPVEQGAAEVSAPMQMPPMQANAMPGGAVPGGADPVGKTRIVIPSAEQPQQQVQRPQVMPQPQVQQPQAQRPQVVPQQQVQQPQQQVQQPQPRQQEQPAAQPAPAQQQGYVPRKTVIRPPMGAAAAAAAKMPENARKLVGFLVTYNRTPMGKVYNIYEGRNTIGHDESCDICIPDDNQISSIHMTIRYLSGNQKYRFKDEMSSNGTYVNKELVDEGELQNYDIVRLGTTLFVFIAIPQI